VSFPYTLGQVTTTVPPVTTSDPAGWIRSVWNNYVELGPKILGLAHEAATLKATSTPGSDQYNNAQTMLTAAVDLYKLQQSTQIKVEEYASSIGLGVVFTTAAVVVALAALAGIMAWCFVRYASLSKALDAVNAGTVSPSQAKSILDSSGPVPSLNVLGGITSTLVVGGLLVAAALWFLSRRRRENPYLTVLGANPPPEDGTWSSRVLSLDYIHDDDGQAYTHTFRPGVKMRALEDGTVQLYNPRKRIWREF